MFRYRLVDEFWTHVGEFESEIPDWTAGQEFVLPPGRRYVIREVHPTVAEQAEYTATWVVERR
jgi:hypothetical protein